MFLKDDEGFSKGRGHLCYPQHVYSVLQNNISLSWFFCCSQKIPLWFIFIVVKSLLLIQTVPSSKILVFQECSLSQTLLTAFINSLLRHYKWNYCLKLLIQEGCSLSHLPMYMFCSICFTSEHWM